MVRLKIVSGRMAGTEQVARHFPFRIGRSAEADFQLEEGGVWDEHAELSFDTINGFVLTAQQNALTTINGYLVEAAILRNGDMIEIGALKIRFWISETRQRSLRWRERLTWLGIALVTVAQAGLIWWLLRQAGMV